MKKFLCSCLACILVLLAVGCKDTTKPDPENPVKITAWTYYNGAQQEAFDALIAEFNNTQGLKQGIVVEHRSQGAINTLSQELALAAKGGAGAQALPNLAMAYAETAYTLQAMDLLVPAETYFSKEELAAYVPAFLEEGRLTENGSIYMLPVAKSTEILAINQTDWDLFAGETGADIGALATIEGVVETAKQYYEWTDAQTAAPGDGKAFFGRDAMDNYMIIGSAQLGKALFPQNGDSTAAMVDQAVMRTLWDHYYVPFMKGYFAAEGKFSSDDIKTGKVIAYVGSSSSVGFFPKKVTMADDSTYDITATILPAPLFAQAGIGYRVQQGAGLCMLKGEKPVEYASAEFLKWFTAETQNLKFSAQTSYLPVTLSANEQGKLDALAEDKTSISYMTRKVGAQTILEGDLYINKPFAGMDVARRAMKGTMADLAKADYAAMQEEISKGTDPQQALAPYLADAYFEQWYQSFSAEFMDALGR